MLGYLTLAGWTLNIVLGLKMHGIKQFPVGVVLAHAFVALTGYIAWIVYLTSGQPEKLGWFAAVWLIVVNGFGDASVVRRWKKKADGGLGLVGTYIKRVTARKILLTHAIVAGVTTVLAFVTVIQG